jgi:hypothetical protein
MAKYVVVANPSNPTHASKVRHALASFLLRRARREVVFMERLEVLRDGTAGLDMSYSPIAFNLGE